MAHVEPTLGSIADTWRVMQFIEANRHCAEQLEEMAERTSPEHAQLLIRLAQKRRMDAAQAYALWASRESPARVRA